MYIRVNGVRTHIMEFQFNLSEMCDTRSQRKYVNDRINILKNNYKENGRYVITVPNKESFIVDTFVGNELEYAIHCILLEMDKLNIDSPDYEALECKVDNLLKEYRKEAN